MRPLLILFLMAVVVHGADPQKSPPKPGAPVLKQALPRGLERGQTNRIQITGDHLTGPLQLKLLNPKLSGRILNEPSTDKKVFVEITPAADLPRGSHEISVVGPGGESSRLTVFVDDHRQIVEPVKSQALEPVALPVSIWGTLEKVAEVDEFRIQVNTGQTLVFHLAAKSLGSKAANIALAITDSAGALLAASNGFEGEEPLLSHTFARAGVCTLRISDRQVGASPEHFYRLTMGSFAFVTGVFPMAVTSGTNRTVSLLGLNLPKDARATINAAAAAETEVPVDADKFRSLRPLKVMVTAESELIETEPNDTSATAGMMTIPGSIHGRLQPSAKSALPDADHFRFDAKAGEHWIVETLASRRGSPLDTKIEILHAGGQPVQRLLLQAVRNSAINFRGVDANSADIRLDQWEEMDLNEFVYFQGEVCKTFRMPRGPDSGFAFYTAAGKRKGYFDTSATAHANDETCYTVIPQPLGAKLVSNGLPVFTLNYTNDDDAERALGADSRLNFIVPTDGTYLVRITDSRGLGGERFVYRLSLRRAQPDFNVTITGANPSLPADTGKGFTVKIDRRDGFDGAVKIDISGVPEGFAVSQPLLIEAGHEEAVGTIYALAGTNLNAKTDWNQMKVSASATIAEKTVLKTIPNLGKVTVTEPKPKLYLDLENFPTGTTRQPVVIAPGETVSVLIKVRRNGNADLVNLNVFNLPHGVIVDNIGLSGVQIRSGENEREVFITCSKWVAEQDRHFHAGIDATQTSQPLLLQVRRPKVGLK